MTTIKELAGILGLFRQPPVEAVGGDELVSKLMPLVIDLRAAARKNKNFAIADKIRDALGPLDIVLEDRSGGTDWTQATAGEAASAAGQTANAMMQLLIELRAGARATKDFPTADTIRNRLSEIGVALEDRPAGTEWTRS
jgi:cysteinyl-tRNA synthetase